MMDWVQKAQEGVFKLGKGQQEARELLAYGKTNRVLTERFNIMLLTCRAIIGVTSWAWLEDICVECEQGQLVMDGYSRTQFIEAILAEKNEVKKPKGIFGEGGDNK